MISLQGTGVETRLERWNSNRFGFRNVTCKDTPSFKQRGIDGIIISVVLCSKFQKELSEEDGYSQGSRNNPFIKGKRSGKANFDETVGIDACPRGVYYH